jgi:hypothetical protein
VREWVATVRLVEGAASRYARRERFRVLLARRSLKSEGASGAPNHATIPTF